MSTSSHPDLQATNSQVLGPSDSISLSLPSEPPDIRNWFSSYVYESPELNTFDGFQGFDGSGETCLDKEKKGKSGENQPIGNLDDGLISAASKSSDGIVKCTEPDVLEHSNPAAVVTGMSESLPFSSEPLDIRNLFSSYVYESSPLDSTEDFTISEYEKREDSQLCNAQKSCSKGVMNFIDVEESAELPSETRMSGVVVKCTNLVKDTKLVFQSVCKDVHNVDLKPVPSTLGQLTSEMVSEKVLPGQRKANNSHAPVEKFGNTNTLCKDYDVKLDYSLIDRTSPKSLNIKNNKSNVRKDRVKDDLENEDLHESVSPKGDHWRRSTDRSSIGKENEETNILENGFISVRKKSSQANTLNITRPVQVQFESIRDGVKPPQNPQKDAYISRKVLSETSNFHSPNILESIGKWRCPQKNKPNLGPPLKQLRLEQWVRRV